MAYVDFDVDDYIEEASDTALIEEVVDRCYEKDFMERLRAKISNLVTVEVEDEFIVAQQYFERGDLNEAMVYLRRALGWHGLDKAKLVV